MSRQVIVTGSGGLIGSTVARVLLENGYTVLGIDDDHRSKFFGPEATVNPVIDELCNKYRGYTHVQESITNIFEMQTLFNEQMFRSDRITVGVIHCAAQPSHDWAASDAFADFTTNAQGTLTILEAMRQSGMKCVLAHLSTNKVYGDVPNYFAYEDRGTRFEPIDPDMWDGFDEHLRIDHCTHSLFGCSKLSADMYVQEYGRYFGIPTVVLRGGCLTGAAHQGVELHGFLSYLTKCVVQGKPFRIIGWGGKQVRDNIDARDVAGALKCIIERPPTGSKVYNIGGGRLNSCSVLEAIEMVEHLSGRTTRKTMVPDNRIGDHKWWITNTRKFEMDYPEWIRRYSLEVILTDMVNHELSRL